jgi:hypothetical protein
MTDLLETYRLSRGRFENEIRPLSTAQLRWRMHSGALSAGEMALHVAGVEVSFHAQLTELELTEFESRLKAAATDGVVNNLPFPFELDSVTAERVAEALAIGRERAEGLLAANDPEIRAKRLISALGPEITGAGALQRYAFHPAYHQGQVYQLVTHPAFPPAETL